MQCNVEDTSVLPRSGKNLCEWKQVRSGSIFTMAVNVNTCTNQNVALVVHVFLNKVVI